MRGGRCAGIALTASIAALGAAAGPAAAATITVTTTDGASATQCTLPDALSAAENDVTTGHCTRTGPAGADTIDFTVTGQITMTSAATVPDGTTIAGPGAGQLDLTRTGNGRIVFVNSGATAAISGLKISGAHNDDTATTDVLATGGGILNDGTLTLTGDVITSNEDTATNSGSGGAEAEGAGIYNDGGTLHLIQTSVDHNISTGDYTGPNGNASGGSAAGAGIYVSEGSVTLDQSLVAVNTATGEGGIGATASAGGISDAGGALTISRSTVADNNGDGVTVPSAGGVATFDLAPGQASLVLKSATIADNFGGIGGSQLAAYGTGDHTAANSIIAGSSGGQACESGGSFASQGHNLEYSGTDCGFDAPGTDIANRDPLLGPLADNGGPTMTMALLPGSPAIDAGEATSGESTDQRGMPRPSDFPAIPNSGDGSDIGAYELQYVPPAPPSTGATPTPAAPAKKCKKKKRSAAAAKKKKCGKKKK